MKLSYNTVISRRPDSGSCIHEGPEFAIGWRAFQPGEVFPAHYHQHFEEVFICVAGSLVVTIDEVNHLLHVGDRVVVERGRVHSLANHSDQISEICYLKVPPVDGDTVWVQPAPPPPPIPMFPY